MGNFGMNLLILVFANGLELPPADPSNPVASAQHNW